MRITVMAMLAVLFACAGALYAQPEIDVQMNAASIADGGSVNIGNKTGKGVQNLTFTILNTGTTDLNLTGPAPVVCTSPKQLDYLLTQPAGLVVAASSSITFTLAVDPNGDGKYSVVVTINNDDSDEAVYNFTVRGNTGTEKKDDDDCSTNAGSGPGMLVLVGLLSVVVLGARLRRNAA